MAIMHVCQKVECIQGTQKKIAAAVTAVRSEYKSINELAHQDQKKK